MRIISGKFKGRRFIPPARNWPTRPTTDMAKESLFNILNNRIDYEETIMLDLFGGTGNHCYECVSRGCKDATYVDNFGACIGFVTGIVKELKLESNVNIIKSDVFKFLAKNVKQYTYIFADPPYDLKRLNELPDEIFTKDTLAEGGLLVIEHSTNHDFTLHSRFVEERKYGATLLSFFQ
ncbi:MAG: RsmD family RNA methyltransferase [Saprospiraceae bacterium]|nr:RsmD family RNA methyltransferase [Saprospiraceae bacterium]